MRHLVYESSWCSMSILLHDEMVVISVMPTSHLTSIPRSGLRIWWSGSRDLRWRHWIRDGHDDICGPHPRACPIWDTVYTLYEMHNTPYEAMVSICTTGWSTWIHGWIWWSHLGLYRDPPPEHSMSCRDLGCLLALLVVSQHGDAQDGRPPKQVHTCVWTHRAPSHWWRVGSTLVEGWQ